MMVAIRLYIYILQYVHLSIQRVNDNLLYKYIVTVNKQTTTTTNNHYYYYYFYYYCSNNHYYYYYYYWNFRVFVADHSSTTDHSLYCRIDSECCWSLSDVSFDNFTFLIHIYNIRLVLRGNNRVIREISLSLCVA